MKKIKVIITGSTGMIGKGVLLECLENEHVENVLAINRQSLEITHPKLKEILHADYSNFTPLIQEFKDYNACFFCLGVSAAGMTEEKYHHITFEITANFAKVVKESNPAATFIYVSGAGTDSTEKGRTMWARVKGKTENTLLSMGFENAYMFRPGLIQPMRGIKSRTPAYNIIYWMLKPFYPLLKKMKNAYTNTDRMGKAMINATLHGFDKRVLEVRDINELAEV